MLEVDPAISGSSTLIRGRVGVVRKDVLVTIKGTARDTTHLNNAIIVILGSTLPY